jgi:hypothetical protein
MTSYTKEIFQKMHPWNVLVILNLTPEIVHYHVITYLKNMLKNVNITLVSSQVLLFN